MGHPVGELKLEPGRASFAQSPDGMERTVTTKKESRESTEFNAFSILSIVVTGPLPHSYYHRLNWKRFRKAVRYLLDAFQSFPR